MTSAALDRQKRGRQKLKYIRERKRNMREREGKPAHVKMMLPSEMKSS